MFAFVWLALLPLSLMSAHVGVLLWVWVALLSPNELLMGFMAGVPFNKLVALTTVVLFAVSRERKEPYLDPILTLLLLLALSGTISWATGLVSSDLTNDLYQKLLKEIVLAFMITWIMTTRHRLHLLVLIVVAALGFLSVKEGVISLITLGSHKILGSGGVGDNNSVATALLMIIPLTYYLARHSGVRLVRLGLYGVLALSLISVVMTFSRGGFLGLLVLGLITVGKSGSKLKTALVVVVAGLLIYTLAPAAWFDRLNTIKDADNDGSFMGRVVAWKISLLLAMDHPFFGGGLHAVQHINVWEAYKPFLPSLDFIKTPPADVVPHAAHSIYFEVLGDLGFVGLFLFLSLLIGAIVQCGRTSRAARKHASLQWAADLASMAQISLLLYMVTGAALSMGYFELVYIMLGMVSRCRRIVASTLAAESHDSPLFGAASLPAKLPELAAFDVA